MPMNSPLLRKNASVTGFPNEVLILEEGKCRLFEADSRRIAGKRIFIAVSDDGSIDYPQYDPEEEEVTWNIEKRFKKKYRDKVKKFFKGKAEATGLAPAKAASIPPKTWECRNCPAWGTDKESAIEHSVNRNHGIRTLDPQTGREKGLTAAEKPKCPHCGSSEYSLMPTDFETAKCKSCGKNWDHGIVPGVNDPKTAAYNIHDVRQLANNLRQADHEQALTLAETFHQAVKATKSRPLTEASRHYIDCLKNLQRRKEQLGAVPPRTIRSCDRAWDILDMAITQYLR